MLLDDLVEVIEKLKERITAHGPSLRASETRTRMALIDPLLGALGWDVTDPEMVTPEYSVGNGRADYALLSKDMTPVAFIEAKHLGEPLERPQHEDQLFTYALRQQVKFAALTDGNRWLLDDVSVFSGGERRLLQISIANMPTHESALKLLLLWRANLATGQPVAANEPVLATQEQVVETEVTSFPITQSAPSEALPPPISPTSTIPTSIIPVCGKWQPINTVSPGKREKSPTGIKFGESEPRPIEEWWQVLTELAEWLVKDGVLTAKKLPIEGMGFINSSPIGPRGKAFGGSREVSGGIYLNVKLGLTDIVKHSNRLLDHFGVDPETVELRFE